MVKFELGNLIKMPQLLKIPELVMAFITMMVARLAPYKSPLTYETESLPIRLETVDATITLQLVVYGFVMIALVQLLGIIGGDRAPVQDTLFGLCGFTLYISVGAKTAASFRYDFGFGLKDQAAAYGGFASMCILTSLVYLVDVVFSLVNLKKLFSQNHLYPL